MRVLILGCGYVGLPLGEELVRQGHEVFGVRRSAETNLALERVGIRPLVADLTRRSDLARLPAPFEWVVNTVSAGRGGEVDYRQVYLDGTQNLLDWLASAPPKKYVYTSSTSVYGQTDGSQITEADTAKPPNETGRILLATEELLLRAAREREFPAVILRVAGIYGPGRGYWFRQYREGQARIEGQGQRVLNMIHRDDLVRIIITALEQGRPGEIYNAVDDEPVTQLEFFRWLAETLGGGMPPSNPEPVGSSRKRGATNKHVLNHKLKR